MNALLVILAVSNLSSGTVIFRDDFDVPGQHQWQLGPLWSYSPISTLKEYYQDQAIFKISAEDQAYSPEILIPVDTESLSIAFEYQYTISLGANGTGFMGFTLEAGIASNPSWWFIVDEDSAVGPPRTWTGEDTLLLFIPQQYWEPGGSLVLGFNGEAYSENANQYELAYLMIDWDIKWVEVMAYDQVGLEQFTWASVKAVF